MWMVPPQFLALDIETTAGDPSEAEQWMRRRWNPNPKWKPATIGSRFLEAYEKKLERLALLDTAPIISVALRSEADCRLLHWMPCEAEQVAGVPLERFPDEGAMLRRLRDLLDLCTPETVLVGHNVRRFDLPKIRQAMLRHGVRLPQCLVAHDQPIFDTMLEWNRYTLDERPMVPLAEVLEVCGLPNHKALTDGALVPELFQQGSYQEILTYAVADILAEWALFERLTGRTGDAAPQPENPQPQPPLAAEAAADVEPQETPPPAQAPARTDGQEETDEVEDLLREFQT